MNRDQIIKRKVAIYASYEQWGYRDYPEDTFSLSSRTDDEKSLYDFMKSVQRRTEGIVLFNIQKIKFYSKKVVVDQFGDEYFSDDTEEIEAPLYFNGAAIKFKNLMEQVNKRIPVIKDLRWKKEKEEKERKQLQELQEKYKS